MEKYYLLYWEFQGKKTEMRTFVTDLKSLKKEAMEYKNGIKDVKKYKNDGKFIIEDNSGNVISKY